MNNKKIKIFTILTASILMFAVSCMENPSRPKRSSGGQEDITITLGDGSTVSVPVDTGDYWQDNEKLTEIYSNQISANYIYDAIELRYKFADNLDMVDPKNDNTVYKKYIKTVLVKVHDKGDQYSSASLHGKYVAGGVYEVMIEHKDEKTIANQPKVGEYEIVIYNYSASDRVKLPNSDVYKNLNLLYRYNLPSSYANSNYDPEKVFDGTYQQIDDIPAYWFILPAEYAK